MLGLVCGLMFLTRQNTIGVGLALALYLAVLRVRERRLDRLAGELGAATAAALLVIGLAALVLGLLGGLTEFWDAAFRYNWIYSGVPLRTRLISLVIGINSISKGGLALAGILGYALALALRRQAVGASSMPYPLPALLEVGLIALPLELALVNLAGRSHPHYYISLLPLLALFVAFLIQQLERSWQAAALPAARPVRPGRRDGAGDILVVGGGCLPGDCGAAPAGCTRSGRCAAGRRASG